MVTEGVLPGKMFNCALRSAGKHVMKGPLSVCLSATLPSSCKIQSS